MTQTKAELLQTRHQGDIRLGDADSTNYVGFKAPATVGSNLVWTLPATDGSANQFLQTNASGVLSWGSADVSSAMPLTGGTLTGDVTFTGAAANIVFDKSSNALEFKDSAKASFGDLDGDLEIYHESGQSYITNSTGNLRIDADALRLRSKTGSEDYISANVNGAVELFHNNVKTFATEDNGIYVYGPEGGQAHILLYADEGDDNADKWRIKADTSGNFKVGNFSTGSWVDGLTLDGSGNVGVGQSPNTKFNVVLAAQVADGTDDASDWGAGGIFQLDATGTAAANNEILFIGAHSGGVGQIASGIGFGRESTSNWGTYLSFKTHSADTSNMDALEERLRISANGNATFAGNIATTNDGTSSLALKLQAGATWGIRSNSTSGTNPYGLDIYKGSGGTDVKFKIDQNGAATFAGNVTTGELIVEATQNSAVDLVVRNNNNSQNAAVAKLSIEAGDNANQGALLRLEQNGAYHEFESRANGSLYLNDNGTTILTLDNNGNAQFTETVSDNKGNLRSIPKLIKSANHTLVASDAGQCIFVNAAGNVTVNNGVLTLGDAVSIVNHHSADITIIQDSGMTMYNSADASTGNRTLASRGMATIWFAADDTAYISGAGLS